MRVEFKGLSQGLKDLSLIIEGSSLTIDGW